MKSELIAVVFAFVPILAAAQYGSAPTNYYPDGYTGSTFTGVVTETQGDQIMLLYTKGEKGDTFIGRLETGCGVPTADGSPHLMMPADIPTGTVMTAYFNRITREGSTAEDQRKRDYRDIF